MTTGRSYRIANSCTLPYSVKFRLHFHQLVQQADRLILDGEKNVITMFRGRSLPTSLRFRLPPLSSLAGASAVSLPLLPSLSSGLIGCLMPPPHQGPRPHFSALFII